jgi:hypothetical protein
LPAPDSGPGTEFVYQAIDLGAAKVYATHPMIGPAQLIPVWRWPS